MDIKKNTPMIEQYLSIKKDYPDGFLFYRMGDFYEMFFEDAIVASKILNITLTKRNANSDIPMAGVPYHAADNYISKLVSNGFSVVICEQIEEAVSGKLVSRAVDRVITPSTASEDTIVSPNDRVVLASVFYSHSYYSIVEFDVSSGDFLFSIYKEKDEVISKLQNEGFSEVICPEFIYESFSIEKIKGMKILEDDVFNYSQSVKKLKSLNLLDANYLRKNNFKPAISSAGSIISYIETLQYKFFPYAKSLTSIEDSSYVKMNSATIKNLELISNEDGFDDHTLYSTLNYTSTSMGARKLKRWICKPSSDKNVVLHRLNFVDSIIKNNTMSEISEILSTIPDIERIVTRISQMNVSPRDLCSLKNAILNIPDLTLILSKIDTNQSYINEIPDYNSFLSIMVDAISDDSPQFLRDGGVINDGYDSLLDEFRSISDNITDVLFDIEEREKIKTTIDKFKISYNKVIGFYIPVSKSKIKFVPSHYILKQSLKNENRYTIIELNSLEEKMITANTKALSQEKIVYNNILSELQKYLSDINKIANFISELDVLNSFSIVSYKQSYIKPNVFSYETRIVNGRHPVLEGDKSFYFTPNDFFINSKKLILLTGPNMGGKSTYMRQNALIYIMAYMGCFVPADFSNIKYVDEIFTRIGSGDRLSEGLSTFMVEMKEGAYILNNATKNSLVLIDEIGRGTSTYDGLSIASAFVDRLSNLCDTIFSTHYFELTDVESFNKNVVNMYMKSTKFNDEIIFMHKIDFGYIDQSYGIEVAKIAGLDSEMIKYAQLKLEELKQNDINKINNSRS